MFFVRYGTHIKTICRKYDGLRKKRLSFFYTNSVCSSACIILIFFAISEPHRSSDYDTFLSHSNERVQSVCTSKTKCQSIEKKKKKKITFLTILYTYII